MAAQQKLPGTGLEDVRIPGQTFLRDALTSCTDPLKAIETFQVIYSPYKIILNFTNNLLIHRYLFFLGGKWNIITIIASNATVA